MSEKSERLKSARFASGYRFASKAARDMNVPVPSYSHHENGARDFDDATAREYADFFRVTPTWLILGEGPRDLKPVNVVQDDEANPPAIVPVQRFEANASPPAPLNFPVRRLPMVGHAIAGEDGRFVLNGQRLMDVMCPPQLLDVVGAYGVFVHGGSMEPRYFSGEAVFVNPHVPVRSGNFVVSQIAGDFEGDDIAGYVKRFVSMNSRELVLEQMQEREDVDPSEPTGERYILRFPRSKVIAVHKIVASGEV